MKIDRLSYVGAAANSAATVAADMGLDYIAPTKDLIAALDHENFGVAKLRAANDRILAYRWNPNNQSAHTTADKVICQDVARNTITKARHGLNTGDAVYAAVSVNGLSANTIYYAIRLTADEFQLADSHTDAILKKHRQLSGEADLTLIHHLDPDQIMHIPGSGSPIDGSSGAWNLVYDGPAKAEWFGLTSEAVQKFLNYFCNQKSSSKAKKLQFVGKYEISQTVVIPDPSNVSIDAAGALFFTNSDILMIDANGRADPTYNDNESRQHFYWSGGQFICNTSETAKATAFRLLGFRHARLEPESFRGFYRDIIVGGKDTISIGRYKTFDVKHSIEVPPWSSIGGPINLFCENIHASIGKSKRGKLIRSWQPLTDSAIRDFSCNMGSGANQKGAIDVQRSVLIGVPSISGRFIEGETISGSTSNASAQLLEIYRHDFGFRIDQHIDWLVAGDRIGEFVNGETLVGLSSGASAAVGNDKAYLTQNREWTNFKIGGVPHFEAGKSADGAICIRLRDLENNGKRPSNFAIDVGTCGVNGGGAIGLLLKRIGNATIEGRFVQTEQNGKPIKLDPGCRNIRIKGSTVFSSGRIDLNGMQRDQLILSEFDRIFSELAVIRQSSLEQIPSGTSTEYLVDMSDSLDEFSRVAGLAPRAYGLMISMRASSATTAELTRLELFQPNEIDAARRSVIDITNKKNNTYYSKHFVINTDNNGNFGCLVINSRGGIANIVINVNSIHY